MNLHLTGHHVDITASIGDYVKNKLERINRHFDHVIGVSVILSIEKLVQRAEATVHVAGHDFHTLSEHEDMYAAIDLLADKLDRQIIKHKEKLTENRRQSTDINDQPDD